MSLSYSHRVYKGLFIYGTITHASMTGQSGDKFNIDKRILGADNIHFPILSLTNIDDNNELSDKYSSMGYRLRLDPPQSMMNTQSIDIGTKLNLLRGTKLDLYLEGNLSLINLEWTGVLLQQVVTIENNTWFNDVVMGKPDIVLNTASHEHFLDWGAGYGLGINYYFNSFLIIGANGHYNHYQNDAQNLLTWGIKLGIKLGK